MKECTRLWCIGYRSDANAAHEAVIYSGTYYVHATPYACVCVCDHKCGSQLSLQLHSNHPENGNHERGKIAMH